VNLPNFFLRRFTHQCIAITDIIIPVSHYTKSLLPEWLLITHPSVHIIPNGIEFEPIPDGFRYGKRLIGDPVLLTVGHVSYRKGQHRVIRALPELLKRFPNAHYHIVGRPIRQFDFEQLAIELDVMGHVTFHGRVEKHSDLANFYLGSDIFMLLSENQPDGDVEGFGIVALEANQFGLPVIGAKGSGVEEAVLHCQSGYWVNGNDSLAIVEAVTFCLDNRDALVSGSKAWASTHQWSAIVPQYSPFLS
jgi:phosphatidylinositol alpha-1,6-mannosyltransferase